MALLKAAGLLRANYLTYTAASGMADGWPGVEIWGRQCSGQILPCFFLQFSTALIFESPVFPL